MRSCCTKSRSKSLAIAWRGNAPPALVGYLLVVPPEKKAKDDYLWAYADGEADSFSNERAGEPDTPADHAPMVAPRGDLLEVSEPSDSGDEGSPPIWDVIYRPTLVPKISVDRQIAEKTRWSGDTNRTLDKGDAMYGFWSVVACALGHVKDPVGKAVQRLTHWTGTSVECDEGDGGFKALVEDVKVCIGSKEFIENVLLIDNVDTAFKDLSMWPVIMRDAHCTVLYVSVNDEVVGVISMGIDMTADAIKMAELLHSSCHTFTSEV